ncbi:helix-turn-helix domain-containing protein [Caenimonas aquaedulcis]|uniref:Helix-turn-helix domain-containing protein n=1 Tax=Caenimonas aquaedulcis TaxID=2793270 RepID=A0A931H4I8_9BURK|nr:helix-turn-helix domain-containing protein [Caenimonas aquaedulcis]MBG9388320.1 helix-turn-helix domain-containing protein [Caenimonas aquaedulcis]
MKPVTAPDLPHEATLGAMGKRIREQRRAQRVNATAAAEAAGISRMTLHRIERGEPSVAIGAYASVMAALGLDLAATPRSAPHYPHAAEPDPWIPARVQLARYPQLRQLAWQLKEGAELTPAEAFDIYERNARHLDVQALETAERDLITALRIAFSTRRDV